MAEPNFLKDTQLKKGQPRGTSSSEPKPMRDAVAVNLVAQTVSQEVAKKLEKRNLSQIGVSFSIAAGTSLLVFGAFYLYGLLVQKSFIPLSGQIHSIQEEISAIEKKSQDLMAFQNRLTASKKLLDTHIYWTQFISELEKITAPNVTYNNLSVSASNVISLSAFAPDFATVGRQYRAYQKAAHLFSEIQINSADALLNQTGDVIGVRFQVAFLMNPEILKKK